eukprot:gene7874-5501_t
MFVYLSKRIAIPNETTITSIGWHEGEGWLACGCAGGLLKVLKVDGGAQGQKSGGLSINQTLERHDATVNLVAWNEQCRRLTSSDVKGQIVVWTLHKGLWFEGMVNNRNKSHVVDLAWSVGGKKICITYADGVVTVGGVDGNRLWSKALDLELERCCWSADDQYVLFGTKDGRVLVHDAAEGHPLSRITIQCLDEEDNNTINRVSSPSKKAPGGGEEGVPTASAIPNHRIIGLQWCPTWVDRPEPLPMLTICYDNGKVQLMRSISDERPVIFDAGLPAQHIAWNPQGNCLAIAGVVAGSTPESSTVAVNFFNQEGALQRTLRVSGKHTGGLSWEGDGLRIALAVDYSVYFANIRPEYKYGYVSGSAIYSFNRPDKVEDSVCFWNTKTNDRKIRHVRNLRHLSAAHDACLLVSQPDDTSMSMVQLLNPIGCPISTRFVGLDPVVCEMNSSHLVVCGEENVYLWELRDPSVKVDAVDPISMQVSRGAVKERIFHIDDIIRPNTPSDMSIKSAITNDVICTATMSAEHMVIGRECCCRRAQSVHFNCNSTTLGVVDAAGILRLFAIERDTWSLVPRKALPIQGFERKDVWCVKWAEDNPKMLAFIEKSRLSIANGLMCEDPVHTTSNLCQFKALKVKGIQFDELLFEPEKPRKECMSEFETARLRGIREKLAVGQLKEAFDDVEHDPHPKLWSLLAEDSLGRLDFPHAEMAIIAAKDYPALQFVKRVKALDDPRKRLAEIESFHRHFEESEKIFKSLDRKDLALEMRERLGDWFGVVRLVQEGGGDESKMVASWENIGDNYAEGNKWNKAAQYYAQCRNFRKLANAYYVLENYEMLVQVIKMVEHDRELLIDVGNMLLTVGLAEEAAQAFLAAGEPRMAVDGCVGVNLWETAISLAEEHHLEDVQQLLHKYAKYLIRKDKLPEAIELYRKAGEHDEAAKLLSQLGARCGDGPAACEEVLRAVCAGGGEVPAPEAGSEQGGTQVVEALLHADYKATAPDRLLDTAWRGAEAYHYFLMCQRHILQKNLDAATVVAVRLMEYDDVIAPVDTYCLIALTAYLAGNFSLCSKAFTRLEAAERMDENGGAGGGQLELMDFTMDLDVTSKTMASGGGGGLGGSLMMSGGGASMLTGGGASMLSGMTLQLTNPAKGAAAAASNAAALTYPTVAINDYPTRFADLAVKLFTTHTPLDHTVDSVPCGNCNAYNKEWAPSCIKCGEKFGTCLVTGRCIPHIADSWECAVCRHRALELEIEKFANCPLCHTPIKQRLRRAMMAY